MLTFRYYDDWKDIPLICSKCGWQGTWATASDDDFANGTGYCCPRCKKFVPLMVVMDPTIEEKRANWALLSDREKEALVENEKFLSDFENRKLKSPEQLPDIDLQKFQIQWDERSMDSGADVVLAVGSQIIHAEPRTWGAAKHFGEIAKILHQRYGKRLTDLVPTPRSHLYLFGDDALAMEYVAARRRDLLSDAYD